MAAGKSPKLFFEPTDKRKALKGLHGGRCLAFASPNIKELRSMAQVVSGITKVKAASTDELDEAVYLAQELSKVVGFLILTMGADGILVARYQDEDPPKIHHYHVQYIKDVVNVSGSGDCFASGFIHALLLGLNEAQCLSVGFQAAKTALLTNFTVPLTFNLDLSKKAEFKTIKT